MICRLPFFFQFSTAWVCNYSLVDLLTGRFELIDQSFDLFLPSRLKFGMLQSSRPILCVSIVSTEKTAIDRAGTRKICFDHLDRVGHVSTISAEIQ